MLTNNGPLGSLDLVAIVEQAMNGQTTYYLAQQRVAYAYWQQRQCYRTEGNPRTDRAEAANLLNRTADNHDLDADPW